MFALYKMAHDMLHNNQCLGLPSLMVLALVGEGVASFGQTRHNLSEKENPVVKTLSSCVVKSLVYVALVSTLSFSVLADGYRNPPESASALGKIGGKIAHIDDASAVTINPANLTDLKKPEVMASLTLGYAVREIDSPYGFSDETEDPWAYLPSIFAAWPVADGEYVAGFALTVPYGRFTDWESDVFFAGVSPYYAEQSVINLAPTIAKKLTDKVSIGVGLNIYQSDVMFKQLYPWSSLTMNQADPNGTARFEGDGWGVGANAAITWKVNDKHTLAVVYRSPFSIEYDGDFDINNVPAAAAAMGVTPSSRFETEIDYPTCVSAGYGIQLTDTVRVEFDVEWIEHSRNEELPIDIGMNTALLPSSVIPQGWDDNWTYGVGIDWQFAAEWVARAGYIYLETPTPSETTLPVAAEEDQSVVSIGLGYDSENGHSLDIAFAAGLFDGRKVNDNVNPAVNGDYDFESYLVSLGYGYSF